MTAKDLNENNLRQELISLYEQFINHPKNRENLLKMDKIEQDYSLARDIIKSKIINRAVNLAGNIEEKELSGSNIYLDDKNSIVEAKKMLEALKSE